MRFCCTPARPGWANLPAEAWRDVLPSGAPMRDGAAVGDPVVTANQLFRALAYASKPPNTAAWPMDLGVKTSAVAGKASPA